MYNLDIDVCECWSNKGAKGRITGHRGRNTCLTLLRRNMIELTSLDVRFPFAALYKNAGVPEVMEDPEDEV